ncbi:MAG: B12-binding domain-containing radical SAM protein [Promethearchaeota archaeon]
MKGLRILYIFPFEFPHGPKPYLFFHFCAEPFLRISNYLNSRKNELIGEIHEEYLDLRQEGLPFYCPKNIDKYRTSLENLLSNIYKRFKFDIVAITCLSSPMYLNTIEVANMVKHYINPSCYIIIGGFHATVMPNDFFPEAIPPNFNNYYPKNPTPIDYIVIDEGELSFFHFVQNIFNESQKSRESLREKPIILEKETLEDLNDLPIINLDLFKKYRDNLNDTSTFYIQFNRGCPFKCRFCPSKGHVKSYKIPKYRSLESCIKELEVLANTEWITLKKVWILDPIFFHSKNLRNKFFEKFGKIHHKIPYQVCVFDRIDTCSFEDLKNYKKYNITPFLGLETGSKTLLSHLLKTSKNKLDKFLNKTVEIIKESNRLDLPIMISYMLGVPGTDRQVIEETNSFFFEKKYKGKALIEKYKINLTCWMFGYLCGNTFFEKGEEMFGTIFYLKEWWKKFDKYQSYYANLIKPSKYLSFLESIEYIKDFYKRIYRSQMKLGNIFYNMVRYYSEMKTIKTIQELFEKNFKNSSRSYNVICNV